MKNLKKIISNKTILCVFLATVISGCTTLPRIQQVSQCLTEDGTKAFEQEIYAERGFQRFAENTYKPVIEQRLFGHEVRVVNLENNMNKIYVAGSPDELGHHFKPYLSDMTCTKHICTATLNKTEMLKIYKAKSKKSKGTAVIECTKPVKN